MKAFLLIAGLQLFISAAVPAQTESNDSLPEIKLNEVIVVSKPLINHQKQAKPLSSLEEYLELSSKINMIKRGNYAWEPMVNSMSTERISVTIDGMHIFGACTDKMDPITSYVDVSNLSEVSVSSGQQGASNGPTIGGAIDLVRTKHDFCSPGWNGSFDMGYESNAKLNVYGANLKYVHSRFFIDADFMYRDAANYKAGKKQTVPFSQFTKYNFSSTLGVKVNEKNTMAASFIFDKAKDVGYPALPMDVSNARALIASVQHLAENISPLIEAWETKLYYNTIVHEMDDTKRPEVPIHMDMPGWSNTYGMYSKIKAAKGKHDIGINLNAYYNQAKAEMTMYPNDVSENIMFMYTWPDVRTVYTGLHASDRLSWTKGHTLFYSANAGFHRNTVADEFGLNSLKIFYPDMTASRSRFVYGAQTGYIYQKNALEVNAGIGYGERAPSVSEGYGFYLFNSFDGYDYIGNPNLRNEKSIELQAGISYKIPKLKAGLSTNYFHLFDYILGMHNPQLSPMTIGASGVREYKAVQSAYISNTELTIDYRPHPSWRTKAVLTYSLGKDYLKRNLPLIRPFSFRFNVGYKIKALDLELSVDGAAKQKAFSQAFGEDETPAYATVNFAAGYVFLIEEHRLYLRAGIENLADTYYSTFSDWNNIPRKGRNFYVNVTFAFDKKKTKPE
jgi:iron complex outermembrane recepter protein